MKKITVLMLICCLLFTNGCSFKKKTEDVNNNTNNIDIEPEDNKEDLEEEILYTDDNPIKVGLYANINGNTTLVDKYDSTWGMHQDIIVFSTFYCNDNILNPNTVYGTFNQCKNNYSDIDNYRIGYNVKFTTTDGNSIDETVLNPSDANKVIYTSYLLIYVYDDIIHYQDSWYSHITEEEFNDNTMMTSLKVTGGDNYNLINNPIEITVFTYDSLDDFDENGKYRGNSKYTAILNNI